MSIQAKNAGSDKKSDDIDSHTKTEMLRLHHSELDGNNQFAKEDEWISTEDEPTHDDLCAREQLFLYNAVMDDSDLSQHLADAVNSLKIALAADESARTGKMIYL